MKQLDIRICGKDQAVAQALLRLALSYETGAEKHKRLLGELVYTVLTTVPGTCSFSVPVQDLEKEYIRQLMQTIAAIAGTDKWQQLADKLDRKLFNIRELQVIPLICNKLTDPQIAVLLKLSPSYIRDIHKKIYSKTDCHCKADLIKYVKSHSE